MKLYALLTVAALVAMTGQAHADRLKHGRTQATTCDASGRLPCEFGPRHVAPAFAGGDLVSRARAYMGQTAKQIGLSRRTLWCGAFMAFIAPKAAASVKNPNMARSWAALPRSAPRVGAIAVTSRKGGGHVGVVSGFDANGNPILVSGNHNGRVGEGVYPKRRVVKYVIPYARLPP